MKTRKHKEIETIQLPEDNKTAFEEAKAYQFALGRPFDLSKAREIYQILVQERDYFPF